jgi:hypothetical protein
VTYVGLRASIGCGGGMRQVLLVQQAHPMHTQPTSHHHIQPHPAHPTMTLTCYISKPNRGIEHSS